VNQSVNYFGLKKAIPHWVLKMRKELVLDCCFVRNLLKNMEAESGLRANRGKEVSSSFQFPTVANSVQLISATVFSYV
jgi:hypothetical protein